MGATQRGELFPGDMGSDTYRIEVDSAPTSVTAIPSLATSDYASIAEDYKKFKQACWIDPPRLMGVHYAHFEAEGSVSVTITCPHVVKSCVIHPLRRNVRATIDGARISFRLDTAEPRYTILDIDDLPPLVIVVERPERDVPNPNFSSVLDIGAFVSDSGSVSDRTAGFQRAFAEASRTKKTLYVSAGVYHVNTLKFHRMDGLKVYFAPGSILRTEVSPAGENIHSHGLWFEDSKNIHISGRGCLDHQGFGNFVHGRNAYDHGLISYYVSNDLCPWLSESPVFMMRCSKITMEGFMVRNGRNMNYNIRNSDDVTLRNCKIITPPASCPEYTDGYHTNSCQNVLIENCLAFCNDDCFASGHYTHYDNRDSANHSIRGLVGWNIRANGVRMGFHTYYNLGDYHFENCDFSGYTWRGIMIHPLHDAWEAGRYQRFGKVSFTDCGFDGARSGGPLLEVDGARIASFELMNCVFERHAALQVRGHDQAGQVDKFVVDNVTAGGTKLTAKTDSSFETQFVGELRVS